MGKSQPASQQQRRCSRGRGQVGHTTIPSSGTPGSQDARMRAPQKSKFYKPVSERESLVGDPQVRATRHCKAAIARGLSSCLAAVVLA